MSLPGSNRKRPFGYFIGVAVVLLLTWLFHFSELSFNPATSALSFLLVILFVAIFAGRNPALVTSFAAMASYNFFFLPPYGTWHIAAPQNLVAWAAFTIAAIVVGELSSYAKRRADEAEASRDEVVRVNNEAREAFELAMRADAAEQSEKLKSALLDALTHDMRTPLTSIKAAATTLIDDATARRLDNESRLDLLSVIDEETDRLTWFNQSLVEIARVEGGALLVGESSASIADAVSVAARRNERLMAGRKLIKDLPDTVANVRIDRSSLAEILSVLIANAYKYSSGPEPVIVTANDAADDVQISIIDSGIGIKESEREKIFEKFYRGVNDSRGLGLGLAIAKGIVEAYAGSIGVKPGDGGIGSIFTVTLPKAK